MMPSDLELKTSIIQTLKIISQSGVSVTRDELFSFLNTADFRTMPTREFFDEKFNELLGNISIYMDEVAGTRYYSEINKNAEEMTKVRSEKFLNFKNFSDSFSTKIAELKNNDYILGAFLLDPLWHYENNFSLFLIVKKGTEKLAKFLIHDKQIKIVQIEDVFSYFNNPSSDYIKICKLISVTPLINNFDIYESILFMNMRSFHYVGNFPIKNLTISGNGRRNLEIPEASKFHRFLNKILI